MNAAATPAGAAPFLRDRDGGVLVLRGTNVSGDAKSAPDLLPPCGPADFVRLRQELGLNAIRLLVFWEAIEPDEGRYDARYLAAVRRIVDAAGAAGLWVMVDMHQDVYGRGFGFDGAPEWSLDAALYDAFDPPSPWQLAYFTPQVMTAFDRFWGDPRLRGAFTSAWARLAEALATADAVLAFDLVNEPFWGSTTPQDFDRRIAPALYGALVDAVRARAPRPFIALEPASIANVGVASALVPPARDRLIYAPHLYPPAIEMGFGYDGDRTRLAARLHRIAADAARMGLSAIVGELGARRDVPGARAYLDDVYDVLDEARLGAFQWDMGRGGEASYALWDMAGAPALQAAAIARPHPDRIAGTPIGWRWDRARGLFTAEWNEDGSAKGPTRLSAPALAFPKGFDAAMDGGGRVRVAGSGIDVPQVGGRRRLVVTRR